MNHLNNAQQYITTSLATYYHTLFRNFDFEQINEIDDFDYAEIKHMIYYLCKYCLEKCKVERIVYTLVKGKELSRMVRWKIARVWIA